MAIINTLGGTSLPSLTNSATSSDIRSGKQVINADGEVLTGTMPNVTKPTPTISININGIITAKTEYPTSGYITSGNAQGTREVPVRTAPKAEIKVNSSGLISAYTVMNDGWATASKYTTTKQITSSDVSTLTPSNIKSGVNILGVTGTYEGSSSGGFDGGDWPAQYLNDVTLNKGSSTLSFTIDTGEYYYVGFWGYAVGTDGYEYNFIGASDVRNYLTGTMFCYTPVNDIVSVYFGTTFSGGKTVVTAKGAIPGISSYRNIGVFAAINR